MKRKQLLFSWKDMEIDDEKTMFLGCEFLEKFGPWEETDFVECLVFNHRSKELEEWDDECKVIRRKQILLEVA